MLNFEVPQHDPVINTTQVPVSACFQNLLYDASHWETYMFLWQLSPGIAHLEIILFCLDHWSIYS